MSIRPSYATIAHRQSFKHEHLKLSENSIRLFQVQAGSKDDPISLRITQYAIHKRPQYKAISYTWGSALDSPVILVNGRSFKIHRNLWDLLYHIRQRKDMSFLWADRMCIDQENLAERNFHVQLMHKIYDQASSVLVWLGLPSVDRTEIRAMDFIKELMTVRDQVSKSQFIAMYFNADVQHRWETLMRMCQHHYWGRTWIVQEFLQAPNIEVVCGINSVDWQLFQDLLDVLRQPDLWSQPGISELFQTRPARLSIRRTIKTSTTLCDLLTEYHDSMCTERRDKVYGLIGLASDCGENETTGETIGVKPDYNKSTVQVYADAVHCIKSSLTDLSRLPSVANLVWRTLHLSRSDIEEQSVTGMTDSILNPLQVKPAYIGIVKHVFPPWINSSDLRSKLERFDWGDLVGFEIRSPRPGFGRRSSSRVLPTTLPDDLITKAINALEVDDRLSRLYNYPPIESLKVPPSHQILTGSAKQIFQNEEMNRPELVIEQAEGSEEFRLAFACTNTRRGDTFLQFPGLDSAVIMREHGPRNILIGKAVAIKHCQLKDLMRLDSICEASSWFCPSPSYNDNAGTDSEKQSTYIESDVLSLAELFAND